MRTNLALDIMLFGQCVQSYEWRMPDVVEHGVHDLLVLARVRHMVMWIIVLRRLRAPCTLRLHVGQHPASQRLMTPAKITIFLLR